MNLANSVDPYKLEEVSLRGKVEINLHVHVHCLHETNVSYNVLNDHVVCFFLVLVSRSR